MAQIKFQSKPAKTWNTKAASVKAPWQHTYILLVKSELEHVLALTLILGILLQHLSLTLRRGIMVQIKEISSVNRGILWS